MTRTRSVLLAVIIGLLVAMAFLGRIISVPEPSAFGQASAGSMPTADDPDALSSTWYCAAGTSSEGGAADLALVIGNPVDQARRGTVTWFPEGAEPEMDDFQVGPRDVLTLQASEAVDAASVSAVVELEGGGAAVEHRIAGPAGSDVAPCASAPSSAWHFANGETTRDSNQQLFLFNPFPDHVVVDVTLATDDLRVAPEALQGLPVAPGTTEVIELGEHARRREITATSVVARSGRLIVDRVQRLAGEGGRTGLSLALGAPAPADVWHFPEGRAGDQRSHEWHIYNPGDDEAIVLLEVFPDDAPAPEPLERTVPARSQVVVGGDELVGVEGDAAFRSAVRSINDVPVVAELELLATGEDVRGWSSVLGATSTAARWALPAGDLSDGKVQRLIVSNPGAEPVTASVVVLSGGGVVDVPGARQLELGPSSRVSIELDQEIGRTVVPLLVEADGPVVVERRITGFPDGRYSVSMGIPLE